MLRLILLFCIWPLCVLAQPALKQFSGLKDARQWAAVGRVNVENGGFCTGTLISDRHVLTAGHCAFDAATGQPVDLKHLQFRAGWVNNRALAYRRVRSVFVHPLYRFAQKTDAGSVSHDIAILELDRSIWHPWIIPMPISKAPIIGDTLAIVSYAQGRSENPSLQRPCGFMADKNDAMILNCHVEFGSSGAPIFREGPMGPQIVGIVSSKARMGGTAVALGVKVLPNISDILNVQ